MPLIQYGPALGVGTVGHNELIDFDSPEEFEERAFLDRINTVLPPGLRFKSLRKLPAGTQSLIKEVNRQLVATTEEFKSAVAQAKKGESVLLRVVRENRAFYSVLNPREK